MTIDAVSITFAGLIVCVVALLITLANVYRTMNSRLRDRKLMFEESNARVTELMNILRSERGQMAALDQRNEKLVESVTDGQTALLVSLNTQLRETERRAIEAETAVNLARPALPPAIDPEDAGLSIFEELTQSIDMSGMKITEVEEKDETPKVNRPNARRSSPTRK
jgi:hypothetical protein